MAEVSERDELVQIIMSPESFDSGPPSCGPNDLYAARTADAILAAGYRKPRVVTTAEELDALPAESVVLDPSTWLFRKREDGRYAVAGSAVGYTSATINFPAIVLYEPQP